MHFRPCLRFSWLLLLAAPLLQPPTARADAIDDALGRVTGAKKVLKYLQKQGYKNVGVLRFQVQKGDAKPSYHAGYLNDLMATRLENALIIVQPYDMERLIGVTRHATTVAVKDDPKSSYATAEGRGKFFARRYPLAWGKDAVSVDAFVTGTVQVSADLKTTGIQIEVFDRKDPAKKVLVTTIEPTTDRATLRDMGESFVISKRSMFLFASKGTIPDAEIDDKVPSIIIPDPMVAMAVNNLEKIKEYLEFEVLFDGKAADILPEESGHGKIDGIEVGQKVSIRMKAKAPLGVLLRINGVNTLKEERYEKSSPYEYSWWILEANKDYYVSGFVVPTEKGEARVKEFIVKAPEAVPPTELGEDVSRWGRIDLEVFADGPALGLLPKTKLIKSTTDLLRRDHPPASTFDDAKALVALARSETTDPRGRMFIVGGDEKNVRYETSDFTGTNVARLEIRYFYPK
jgi:hypothetical protein